MPVSLASQRTSNLVVLELSLSSSSLFLRKTRSRAQNPRHSLVDYIPTVTQIQKLELEMFPNSTPNLYQSNIENWKLYKRRKADAMDYSVFPSCSHKMRTVVWVYIRRPECEGANV